MEGNFLLYLDVNVLHHFHPIVSTSACCDVNTMIFIISELTFRLLRLDDSIFRRSLWKISLMQN